MSSRHFHWSRLAQAVPTSAGSIGCQSVLPMSDGEVGTELRSRLIAALANWLYQRSCEA